MKYFLIALSIAVIFLIIIVTIAQAQSVDDILTQNATIAFSWDKYTDVNADGLRLYENKNAAGWVKAKEMPKSTAEDGTIVFENGITGYEVGVGNYCWFVAAYKTGLIEAVSESVCLDLTPASFPTLFNTDVEVMIRLKTP